MKKRRPYLLRRKVNMGGFVARYEELQFDKTLKYIK